MSAAAVQRRDPVGHRGAPSERHARTAATNQVIQAHHGTVMTLIVIVLVVGIARRDNQRGQTPQLSRGEQIGD